MILTIYDDDNPEMFDNKEMHEIHVLYCVETIQPFSGAQDTDIYVLGVCRNHNAIKIPVEVFLND